MPTCRLFATAVLALSSWLPTQTPSPVATPPPAPLPVPHDLVAMAKAVLPSLVCVRTFVRIDPAETTPAPTPHVQGWVVPSSTDEVPRGFRLHGSGSGFFAGHDGEILTCLQPLRVTDERLVDVVEVETQGGQRVLCDVVGVEPTLQLAVLKTAVFQNWERPAMPLLPFADSDALEVGTWLHAFGDPAGPERFLGTGPLVAKPARDCYQELLSASYMQATMAVHPGAFGGPVVDGRGHVVGILMRMEVAGVHSTTSAWALPSKIVQTLHDAIRAAGTTRSPWLGIAVMSRAELAKEKGLPAFQAMPKPRHGILIENVFDPSPAHAAGVRPGDFLMAMEATEIHAPVDFQRQLYLAGVGRRVALTLWREGEELRHELTIEARPAAAQPR